MSETTTVLLIRHGESEGVHDRLVGRQPDVGLTERGHRQAARLPDRLRRCVPSIGSLFVSPLRRAMETATPVARAFGVTAQPMAALAEVDFGDWTGRTFEELQRDPEWRRYNESRATATIPGGESALDLQFRVVHALRQLAGRHRNGPMAIVTHAEVIRAAVLYWANLSLDNFGEVRIEPASITAARVGDSLPDLLFVNDVDDAG